MSVEPSIGGRRRARRRRATPAAELERAGYTIDRISCTDPRGHRTFGYRLHGSPAAADVQALPVRFELRVPSDG
jgi:hypothetical protein